MSILREHGKKRRITEHSDNRNNKHQQLDNERNSSRINLEKCSVCNRHFTHNRLINHEQICKESKKLHLNSLKNYHYNSQFYRWKGLDYKINTKYVKSQIFFPKTHWREKHQQFQDIIKGQHNSITNFIESSDNRPYQCSQCQRKFATENAITKHRKGCTKKSILK